MKMLVLVRRMLTLCALATVAPAHAADVVKGGEIYALQCVSCHGRAGVNVMPAAPNFARGDGLMQPDFALLASIKNGKNAMPAYVGILNDREILDVIAYLRTLRR